MALSVLKVESFVSFTEAEKGAQPMVARKVEPGHISDYLSREQDVHPIGTVIWCWRRLILSTKCSLKMDDSAIAPSIDTRHFMNRSNILKGIAIGTNQDYD